MKVSVVMATHNGAQFIEEQIESILFQSYPVSELIVSDDASTDGTLGTITKTLRKHHNVVPIPRLITLPNSKPLGIAQNFAQGLSASTSPYIALADQDDVWDRDKVKKLLKILAKDSEVFLVHSNAQLTDSHGISLNLSLFEALGITKSELAIEASKLGYRALLKRNLVTGATVMFRKSLLEHALPIPSAWIHDEWLAMIASLLGRVQPTSELLIEYRQHGRNQIGAQKINTAVRMSRLTSDRSERNERLFRLATELKYKVESMGDIVPAGAIHSVNGKLAHERFRVSLSRWRLLRIVPILVHALSGSYVLYGRGFQDFLRDLVQPEGKQ